MNKQKNTLSVFMEKREWIAALIFLPFYEIGIPLGIELLYLLAGTHPDVMSLNILWYLLCSAALLLMFPRFLADNAAKMPRPGTVIKELAITVVLVLICNLIVNEITTAVEYARGSWFTNMNDEAIAEDFGSNTLVLLLTGCLFAPFVEECIFRGIIFSNLYRVKKWLGYAVSTACFVAIHVVPYLAEMTAVDAVLSVLQYLPAALLICRLYRRTDCIFVPMLYHALQNGLAFLTMALV